MSLQIATTSGTFSQPRVEATNQGQTIEFGPTGTTDLDSQYCLQNGLNGYQEFNDFLRIWTTATGQDAKSALIQLKVMIDNMLNTPEVSASRVYEP